VQSRRRVRWCMLPTSSTRRLLGLLKVLRGRARRSRWREALRRGVGGRSRARCILPAETKGAEASFVRRKGCEHVRLGRWRAALQRGGGGRSRALVVAAHLAGGDEGHRVVREAQGLRADEAREMKGGAPARRRWPEPGSGVPTHIVEGDQGAVAVPSSGVPFPLSILKRSPFCCLLFKIFSI
jgi:hypothetical protein